ncbi:hypothetical protein, partial [Bradyrhizobium sp. Leo170]|uniref:hypothetical protein n=1 Tax=Bradyrhizobium sp. Leo170 TaxID=1571199 RepID=UPI0010F1E9C8
NVALSFVLLMIERMPDSAAQTFENGAPERSQPPERPAPGGDLSVVEASARRRPILDLHEDAL